MNRSNVVDVKPCPFCGDHDPYWDEMKVDQEMQLFLICQTCGCQGPYAGSYDVAADLWNVRHQP